MSAAIEEPQPIQTSQSQPVLPFVHLRLGQGGIGILDADLDARAQLGIQRYGTPLMTHNSRNSLNDLYQELLDALMYVGQYELENGVALNFEFEGLKKIATVIKTRLERMAP